MVITASGIALGRVRTTTTTTESRNMAAKLYMLIETQRTSLILEIRVTVDTCLNKVSADQYYVTISRAQV